MFKHLIQLLLFRAPGIGYFLFTFFLWMTQGYWAVRELRLGGVSLVAWATRLCLFYIELYIHAPCPICSHAIYHAFGFAFLIPLAFLF